MTRYEQMAGTKDRFIDFVTSGCVCVNQVDECAECFLHNKEGCLLMSREFVEKWLDEETMNIKEFIEKIASERKVEDKE